MFFCFYKYGYEDADYQGFESREDLEDFIIEETENNEINATGFQVFVVVQGERVDFKVVQRKTEIDWGV